MTAREIHAEIRMLGGRLKARGDRLYVDVPAGAVTPELKARLADRKAELLKLLERELQESTKRLESAHILLAISEDGVLRIVQTDAEAHQAALDGFTIYSPKDAYMYVTLTEHERRVLHDFKKRFGGVTEWKASK